MTMARGLYLYSGLAKRSFKCGDSTKDGCEGNPSWVSTHIFSGCKPPSNGGSSSNSSLGSISYSIIRGLFGRNLPK